MVEVPFEVRYFSSGSPSFVPSYGVLAGPCDGDNDIGDPLLNIVSLLLFFVQFVGLHDSYFWQIDLLHLLQKGVFENDHVLFVFGLVLNELCAQTELVFDYLGHDDGWRDWYVSLFDLLPKTLTDFIVLFVVSHDLLLSLLLAHIVSVLPIHTQVGYGLFLAHFLPCF